MKANYFKNYNYLEGDSNLAYFSFLKSVNMSLTKLA